MKYTVISYTAPNGLRELGVVIKSLGTIGNMTQNLCYGNHKLFILESYTNYYIDEEGRKRQEEILSYGGTIVEGAFLPDYDRVLEVAALSTIVRHP